MYANPDELWQQLKNQEHLDKFDDQDLLELIDRYEYFAGRISEEDKDKLLKVEHRGAVVRMLIEKIEEHESAEYFEEQALYAKDGLTTQTAEHLERPTPGKRDFDESPE